MKIVDGSVKNIDNLFEKLILNVSGANYSVDFEGRVFRYQQDDSFTSETLEQLYEGELRYFDDKERLFIEGPVHSASFDLIKKKVHKYLTLTFTGDPRGYKDFLNESILWSIRPEAAKQRLDAFWGIISAHFTLPPTHCFEHEPEQGSFLGDWDMWVFCYIFLNDITKEGIIIASRAYD
jgi:hypothetical protein